jgi:hypothetical protein
MERWLKRVIDPPFRCNDGVKRCIVGAFILDFAVKNCEGRVNRFKHAPKRREDAPFNAAIGAKRFDLPPKKWVTPLGTW